MDVTAKSLMEHRLYEPKSKSFEYNVSGELLIETQGIEKTYSHVKRISEFNFHTAHLEVSIRDNPPSGHTLQKALTKVIRDYDYQSSSPCEIPNGSMKVESFFAHLTNSGLKFDHNEILIDINEKVLEYLKYEPIEDFNLNIYMEKVFQSHFKTLVISEPYVID